MVRWCVAAIVVTVLALDTSARAAPPEPKGPHPRILLDATLRATWKKQAGQKGSAVARAVARCGELRVQPKQFAKDLYMGLDWAGYLQACLVAHAATGKDEHARTALLYFTAMLDDLGTVGDGKGGNAAAQRDSGFAIRAMGPYTALAYDWLHDHPGMTDALRARARERFTAWTDWYLGKGYRARHPGTNYQAGYLLAATLIAIAEGGEGGADSARLWRHVVDQLWGVDMAKALAPGGVLDGGDWGEGWQYGPLSVAEYALAARALRGVGVDVPGVARWLEALHRRFIHGLSPSGRMFVAGDTQSPDANLEANMLVPGAVVIGDASRESQRQALGEIKRLGLTYKDFPLYGALVEGRGLSPEPVPRDQWPTAYLAPGIGTFYARSDWSDRAVWFVAHCTKTVDVDHIHPNAGNFVLSRGKDDVIVDPSPYGTLSSLTSNAPTVESAHLPEEYKPSQAFWSEKTRYAWAEQRASGLIAMRCDYADQYKFQDRPSDVRAATRDIVVWPRSGDATVVVIDRADSGDPKRGLHLRFRTPATLALQGDSARGKVGSTSVAIQRIESSSGKPEARRLHKGDCFGSSTTRGGCDTPRFDVGEYRIVVRGPAMSAWHVIDASGKSSGDARAITGPGFEGVRVARGGSSLVVARVSGGRDATIPAPGDSTLVVLDAPATGDSTTASGAPGKDGCDVRFSAKGGAVRTSATPAVVTIGKDCTVTTDAPLTTPRAAEAETTAGDETAAFAPPATGEDSSAPSATPPSVPHSPRSGCCGAQSAPEPSVVLGALVIGLAFARRRRASVVS